jgi:hypothetical protein
MASIKAFEMGRESGLSRLAQKQKMQIGQVLSQGDLQKGANTAFGFGDLETGSALSQLYGRQQQQIFEQQQAGEKAAREQQIGAALAGVLPADLGGLAQLSPQLAAQVNNSRQTNERATRVDSRIDGDVNARRRMAQEMGLEPNDPRYSGYVLTGNMPRENAQSLTATDKKELYETDETVQMLDGAKSALSKAIEINEQAGSGYFANAQAFAARNDPTGTFDDAQGEATTEFSNLVMNQALSQMKAIFGSNPTEGERAALLQLQASPDKTPSERKIILQNALGVLERRIAFNKGKAGDIRSQQYFKPQGGQAPLQAPYPGADGVTEQDIAGPVDSGGEYPLEAIEMLTADPSPEARRDFDLTFGEGASLRVMGQ